MNGNNAPPEPGNSGHVIYSRFSSDHQRPTTIEDQAQECRRLAEQRGLPPPGRVVADEGVSVKDGMAGNFKRLLDDVRARKVRRIFVDELSRVSRVTEDILRVQRLLKFHGVELWAVHENIELTDEASDIHVLFAGHKNQAASRDARHRVKRSMDGNLRRGLSNGDLTLGYKSVPLSDEEAAKLGLSARHRDHRPYKRFVIDSKEAELVQQIFHRFVNLKYSIRGLAGLLNEEHAPRGGKARTSRWRQSDVRKILSNRRYLGYRSRNRTTVVMNPDTGTKTIRPQSEDQLVEAVDPSMAIIDQSLFDEAQRRLEVFKQIRGKRNERRSGQGSGLLLDYAPRKLLSGTLVCGECDTKLVQRQVNGVGYYICPSADVRLCTCSVMTRSDTVHSMVLGAIREEAGYGHLADRVHELLVEQLERLQSSAGVDATQLDQELRRVKAEIDNLTGALARRPTSDALLTALDAREAEASALLAKIGEAQRTAEERVTPPTVDWVREMLDQDVEALVSGNISRAAHLIRSITGPIRVYSARKPWMKRRYPLARLQLDLCQLATAVATDQSVWTPGPIEGGFGVIIDLEVRKIPLYEKHAKAVVHMRDVEGLGWRQIARCLPDKMNADYAKAAYMFGKFGDPQLTHPPSDEIQQSSATMAAAD